MIDTIVIRVHNLTKYKFLYEQYYQPDKKTGQTVAFVDPDTGETVEAAKINSVIFHDTNRVLPITHRNSNNIPSSHYTLTYFINTKDNYIEFNFSIPKYLFATNVLQFINPYCQDSKTTFFELKQFLNKFFAENFIQTPIPEDIEIHRLDVCYNQFFNSKEDALRYLEAQKAINKTKSRNSKNSGIYPTSLMYYTHRYSFKIYHKGTEFRKNDYKELVKKNPFNYPLEEFCEKADRILRYEMTFRRSMFTYVLNHFFFNSAAQAENPIVLQNKLVKAFRELFKDQKTDEQRTYIRRAYHKWKRLQKIFTLASIADNTNNALFIMEEKNLTFDLDLFNLLVDVFWKKVKDYQLTGVLNYSQILEKIRERNDNILLQNKIAVQKRKTKDEVRLMLVGMLTQLRPGGIDELKPYFSHTSFYRLKQDLKEAGLGKNEVQLNMPTPKIDYQDYILEFGCYHRYQ